MFKKSLIFIGIVNFGLAEVLSAQTTTWPNNHIFQGDVSIGDAINKAGLEVVGETGNSAVPGIKVTGDGGVVFEGTFGTGTIPATGAGTRMMWYSKKAAFRIGTVNGSQWDDANIGVNSIAIGSYSGAVATEASAFGYGSAALGAGSTALGGGLAIGEKSLALGGYEIDYFRPVSEGQYSCSIGAFSLSEGDLSFAVVGGHTVGVTTLAALFGVASGEASVSIGSGCLSAGNYSWSLGYNSTAASAYGFVIGRNNTDSGSLTAWVDSDPLFVIGNGTGNVSDPVNVRNRNAFLVRKNGDVEMSAKVKMPRQGDILMGEFGDSE